MLLRQKRSIPSLCEKVRQKRGALPALSKLCFHCKQENQTDGIMDDVSVNRKQRRTGCQSAKKQVGNGFNHFPGLSLCVFVCVCVCDFMCVSKSVSLASEPFKSWKVSQGGEPG